MKNEIVKLRYKNNVSIIIILYIFKCLIFYELKTDEKKIIYFCYKKKSIQSQKMETNNNIFLSGKYVKKNNKLA